MEIKETIQHAAVLTVDGEPILARSHAECFRSGQALGREMSRRAKHQGFVTSSGRFVDREEAAKIAVFAGQVIGIEILFSEDLWSPSAGGRFKYDKEKGYYK